MSGGAAFRRVVNDERRSQVAEVIHAYATRMAAWVGRPPKRHSQPGSGSWRTRRNGNPLVTDAPW